MLVTWISYYNDDCEYLKLWYFITICLVVWLFGKLYELLRHHSNRIKWARPLMERINERIYNLQEEAKIKIFTQILRAKDISSKRVDNWIQRHLISSVLPRLLWQFYGLIILIKGYWIKLEKWVYIDVQLECDYMFFLWF